MNSQFHYVINSGLCWFIVFMALSRLLSNPEEVEAKMGILGDAIDRLGFPGHIEFAIRPGYRARNVLLIRNLAVIVRTGDCLSGAPVCQANSGNES